MTARLLTAFIGIPCFLFFLLKGGAVWAAFLSLLVILAAIELDRLYQRCDLRGTGVWICCGGLILLAAAYTSVGDGPVHVSWQMAIGLLALIALAQELAAGEAHRLLHRSAAICLGSLYTGLFAYMYLVRADGIPLALMLVLATWATDTFAFLVGRTLGHTPLAPVLSPHKTREGALAGLAGGVLLGGAVAWYYGWVIWHGMLMGAGVAVAAQIGDLVESAMKREAGVKDSGTLLPGHGGVLDRFDSMLFAGVTVYYLRLLLS